MFWKWYPRPLSGYLGALATSRTRVSHDWSSLIVGVMLFSKVIHGNILEGGNEVEMI